MNKPELSFSCRKALSVHIGDTAAKELIGFLDQLAERIERLEREKGDTVQSVPFATVHKNTPPKRKAA